MATIPQKLKGFLPGANGAIQDCTSSLYLTSGDLRMTDAIRAVAPTGEGERFQVMDLLRGFALCGILLMNIPSMGQFSHLATPPLPAVLNPGWITWWAQGLFFEGTMRGLFTLLFGAGMVLMTMRGDREHGPISIADVYFRRSLLLVLLGGLNFTVLAWFGDILYCYGLSALFLFSFRRLKPWILCLLAGIMIVFLVLGGGFDAKSGVSSAREGMQAVAAREAGQTLTEEQTGAAKAWEERLERRFPTPEKAAEEVKERTNYLTAIGFSISEWSDWGLGPMMIIFMVETIAFMFIGVALFKWGVITGQRSMGFYVAMALICYPIGIGINAWEMLLDWNAGFTPTVWKTGFTYELPRLALTLGHLALVTILFKLNVLGFIGAGLKAIGKMALSNYLGQSLITSVLFYGLGYFARFDWAQLWGIAAIIWVVQGVLSVLWLRVFSMGPMEWLLRCASYGKWQPILIRKVGKAPPGDGMGVPA